MPAQERAECTASCRTATTLLRGFGFRRLFIEDFLYCRHAHCKRTCVPNNRQPNFFVEAFMKSKALIAMAVAGACWSAGSIAGPGVHMSSTTWPSADVNEAPAAMSTILSLDNQTGGYKGW